MPETSEILRFIIQLFTALAGATSLWGAIFFWRSKKLDPEDEDQNLRLVDLLSYFYLASLVVFFTSWWYTALVYFPPGASAHEGIVIKPVLDSIQKGFELNVWFVSLLLISSIVFFLLFTVYKNAFKKFAGWLLFFQFLILSVISLTTIWTGEMSTDQLFFSFHNWHSILTLGTVLTVDFLYIVALLKDDLKKPVYTFFPFLSIAIWMGLGIDFLSVALIFGKAFEVTPQFLFNQTVVGIIIINGALLSGKINDALINLVSVPGQIKRLSHKMIVIFGISGSVSVVSWLSITALDFFRPDWSYGMFWMIYLALIIVAFVFQYVLENVILAPKEVLTGDSGEPASQV